MYSREALQRELTALHDAYNICHYRLIALNGAEFDTFLSLFNVSNKILTRYLEIVQILKGVCDLCGYTPCECPESDEVDRVPFDIMRHLGLPQ